MKKKGALQISFGWLFAIIIGAFIIFLAVFGVTKLMRTEQTTLDAKAGQQIRVLLNPLETSFESAKTTSFTMPTESRIYNGCDDDAGNFGKQLIRISQKSFNKWTETNIDVDFANKYIFSKKIVEGKKFYIFSKPFDFPFKVSDLIYMTSSNDIYCFDTDQLPEEIEDEIKDLNQLNLLVGDCSDNMIKICFSGFSGDCDTNVHYDAGYVEKQDNELHFTSDALMYAAIFGDVEVYECQLKRLMQRIEQLSLIYGDKALLIGNQGCDLEMNADLSDLNALAGNLDNSEDIDMLMTKVNNLNNKNEAAGECRLW